MLFIEGRRKMSKVYTFIELLSEIKEGKIKERNKGKNKRL